jgi:hypothetical protein
MMQPYLFPSLSYFHLICWADVFVSLECVNYKKRGWINRNRLVHPDQRKDWTYFTMPVEDASQNRKIEDVLVASGRNFFSELLGKISAYKNKAKFYNETAEYLSYLSKLTHEFEHIAHFNLAIIRDLSCRLNLNCEVLTDKDVEFKKSQICNPQDWAIEITSALGGGAYANPVGGANLYQSKSFLERDIDLLFLIPNSREYEQGGRSFQANLSVIDALLWNGFEGCRRLVKEFIPVTPEQMPSFGYGIS